MAKYDKQQKAAGSNRKAILNAMEAMKHPRVDVKNVQEIEERINDYLEFCVNQDVAPSVAGCANWLGVSMKTLLCWYSGTHGTPEHQRTAARFYAIMQDIWAQKMDGNEINPVSGIFMGKAFYGYKDTQEIVVQHNGTQDQLSRADLIAESKRLPGADNLALPDGTQTIDADYRVIEKPIENDPNYEKALVRKQRRDASREKAIKRYEHENEYMRNYMRERRKKKLAAEKAQKEAENKAEE